MATEKLCLLALDQYEERLTDIESVVGLGITAVDNGNAADEDLAVAVYVDEAGESGEPSNKQVIPATLEVKRGRKKYQVPVRVIEQGKVWLETFERD